jgi:predicted SnoaL-like aldol condensation-catalyzing enzyme
MTQNKMIIKEVFRSIFENTDYNEPAIRQYFATDYIQHVDGKILNFEEFCKHVQAQKEVLASLRVNFETMIEEGDIVFSNHIANATTKEGKSGSIRVIAEFDIKEGKIAYCNELTHMITGDDNYRDLGSRH